MNPGSSVRPVDGLRLLLGQSVRFGAMSLSEAAMAEAAIARSCGVPGFALRLAAMHDAPQVGLVRSSAAGRRGALIHAFVILDDTSGHQADWLVADVFGILTLGDAARRWSRVEGRLHVDRTPDDVQEQPGEGLTAAVARRLPWFSGLPIASGAQPVAYAVADLAWIGRIIQRCPDASVEARLKELDRTPGRDGPAAEDASGQDLGIGASMTSVSGLLPAGRNGVSRTDAPDRPVDGSALRVGTPVDDRACGVRP